MDAVLENASIELTGLVDDISHYRPIESRTEQIVELDAKLVAALENLKQHYAACRRLEQLEQTSKQLDKGIEDTLVGLADCRKQLESTVDPSPVVEGLSVAELLNYATKITKFTHKQPGAENLPWPTEDAIRRGLLAQLGADQKVEEESEAQDEAETQVKVQKEVRQAPAEPVKKINLDLFDSDED